MMQHGSCECSKTELDVTGVPPTMTAMEDSQWTEHYPISALDNSAPIEFIIPAQTEKWTDLNQTYLYLRVKVINADNTDLADDAHTSVTNNFFHSLFSSVDLYLNNKLVSNTSDTYPYKAYVENLLSYAGDVKSTSLKAMELWIKDTTGHMQANAHDGDNAGFKDRRASIHQSQTLELVGRLHLDLFLQEKYLPNGVEMRLRLNKASPEFCTISQNNVKVKFLQAGFNVRTVDLLPVVANNMNQLIERHNMKIPIRRAEVKTFTIGSGQRSKIEDHLFQGQLPKRIFVGMVRNAYMNGIFANNPFDFQHFNVSKVEVSVDGKPNRTFQTNFGEGECLRAYSSLFQATGSLGMNRSMGLTLEEFQNGYTLFGFDLTPDQGSEEGQLHPIKTGNLRIELQFARALDHAINVIVYAEFDSQIEINSVREVITDY